MNTRNEKLDRAILKPDERRLLDRIARAGRQGIPALTSIEECRAIDAVRKTELVRWTGDRWVHHIYDHPMR